MEGSVEQGMDYWIATGQLAPSPSREWVAQAGIDEGFFVPYDGEEGEEEEVEGEEGEEEEVEEDENHPLQGDGCESELEEAPAGMDGGGEGEEEAAL